MATLQAVTSWLLTNVFGNTSIFMGLLVFIGLLCCGKKFYECLAGFIKAVVGYMVFSTASTGLTNTLRPILFAMKAKLGSSVLILDGYYGQSVVKGVAESLDRALTIYTIGMCIVFFLTLIMVYFKKYTKLRCVNIAGNTINANALMAFGFCIMILPEIPDAWLLAFVVAFGLINLVPANMILEDVQEFTDGAGFTVFHAETLSIWLACRLGERIQKKAAAKGKEVKHWGDIEFPGWLSIFDDITVSSTLVMLVVFGAFMCIVGKEGLEAQGIKIARDFPLYIFETACTFGCYIVILTAGIRMFVSELTVAFNGFSEKLLRGGVPAVDVACTFGFMPNPQVLTIGFFTGTIAATALSALLFGLNAPFVAIMGFTSLFFEQGAVAVFADWKGGIKCQMIMNVFVACLQVLLGGFIVWFLKYPIEFGGFGITSNWALMLAGIIPLLRVLGVVGIVILFVIAIAIPFIQWARDKEGYFLAVEDWEAYKKLKGIE